MALFCCPHGAYKSLNGEIEEPCLIQPYFSANANTVYQCRRCQHYDDLRAKIQSIEEPKKQQKRAPKIEEKLTPFEQKYLQFLLEKQAQKEA